MQMLTQLYLIKIALLPCLLMCFAMLSCGCRPQDNTSLPASDREAAEAGQPTTDIGSDSTRCVRFSPSGKLLATANVDNTVSVWDLDAREEAARLTGHRVPVYSLAFHPKGQLLASAGFEFGTKRGEILIWDMSTNRISKTLEMQDVRFSPICFSPDGKTLASVGPGTSITLWDVATWTPKGNLEPHSNPVHYLEFSPDGKSLAAGLSFYNRESELAEVKLWNTETGEEVGTLQHRWQIQSLSFSPDAKTLAVGDEGQVVLWNVGTQAAQNRLEPASTATFSPNGSLLATIFPGEVTITETNSYHEIARQEANTHAYQAVFSPDGKLLAWGTDQKAGVSLWNLTRLNQATLGSPPTSRQ